jgi:hypothetical protein
MRRTAVAFLFALFIVLIGCSSETSRSGSVAPQPAPQEPYVIPAEFLLKPIAERGLEGEIYISGTTNFPDGMKMWVILGPKKAQQDAFVRGGRFRSGPLCQGVPVLITGSQPLRIIAYFNGAWQNKAVLAALGDGGKNLQGELFKKTDPGVIDSDKILDAKFTLALPAVTPETNAINIVKHAVLTVPGQGRSATDIEQNLTLFTQPGTGVRPAKGWSATPAGKNVYIVAYDFVDGSSGEKQAIWSVNMATRQVKYVNQAAKIFSWTPNY